MTTMKVKRPTRRDINNILGRKIWGWNDKRLNHNRIKLTVRLTDAEQALLGTQLRLMFPSFQFIIEDFQWNSYNWRGGLVTVVRIAEI